MTDIRVTQDIVEIAGETSAPVRVTQDVVEVVGDVSVPIRATQDVIEVAGIISAPVRVTQDIIEIMYRKVDLSGLYFINPAILHDTYYIADKKIPNPTIKTAFLGE